MKKVCRVLIALLLVSASLITLSYAMTDDEFVSKFIELVQKQDGEGKKKLILENKKEARRMFEDIISMAKSEGDKEKKKNFISHAIFIAQVFEENGDESLIKEMQKSGLHLEGGENEKSEGWKNFEEGLNLFQQGKNQEAKIKFEDSLKSAEKENSKKLKFFSFVFLGRVYGETGNYTDALNYYEEAFKNAEKDEENALCYNNIGGVYDAQGKYEDAFINYNKALKLRLNVYGEEHPDVASSYHNIGAVYVNQGRYDEALISYNKALVIRLKVLGEEHPDVATSYASIGVVYDDQGKYEDALLNYNKSLKIRQRVLGEDHPNVAIDYNNIGEVYRKQGKYEDALINHSKALKIKLKVAGEDHPDVAISYNNIGLVFSNQGKYEDALINYNKALKIDLKSYGEEHSSVAIDYNNIGVVYDAQGKYEDALINYDRALQIDLKVHGGEHPNVARDHNNIGEVYRKQSQYEDALINHSKALQIWIKVYGEGHPSVAASYNNIGALYSDQGKYEDALINHNKVLKIRLKVYGEEHPDVAASYHNIGAVYVNQGRYEDALINFDRALKIFIKTYGEEHPSVATSYDYIGVVYCEKKEYTLAKENFIKSINIIEKVRNKMGTDTKTRSSFLDKRLATYKVLISTLYYLKDYEKAFYYLESSKARSLLDEVSKNIIFQSNEIDNNLINELKGVKEKIVSLDNVIASKRNQGQKTDTEEQEVFQSTQDYNKKLQEIYNKYPKYKKLTEAKIVNVDDVQKLLDDKTAFVEYSLGEDKADSFAFVITNNALQMIQLPKINYKDTIDVFRETIKYPANRKQTYYAKGDVIYTERGVKIIAKEKKGDFKEINYKTAQKEVQDKLWTALIEPLEPYIKDKDEIIIVPDAELAFLPVEALKDGEGKYLVERKNISYIQSASLLEKVAGKGQAQGLRLLAFGGAIYNVGAGLAPAQKEDVFLTEKEKEYYKEKTEVLLAQRGALNSVYDDKGYEWVNLPGTEEEARNIGSLFYEKEEDKNNNVLTGNKVTEERIKEMSKEGILKKYKILHFATHGLVELDVPELSAIILSQPDALKTGQPQGLPLQEDGYLTMGEIMTLNLNSELVNLSACETGLGKLVGGEGVTGLTQSFMMAGAKNVSVSLWSVADASTRDFMISFYQKVKEGKSYRTAMVETKREFIKSEKYAEPFYWAPFVLYGGVVSDNEKTVENKMVEPVPDKEQTGKENIIKSKTTASLSGIGPKTILIAKGNKDGIVEGMQFVIKHGDKVIVKLKVVKVNKDFSICDIVEGTSTKVTALDVAEFVEGK